MMVIKPYHMWKECVILLVNAPLKGRIRILQELV
jgi:hypothetical protein